MNILNKQIDSIYDRQKNLYSKYPHYSQQNAESKKVCEQEKITDAGRQYLAELTEEWERYRTVVDDIVKGGNLS